MYSSFGFSSFLDVFKINLSFARIISRILIMFITDLKIFQYVADVTIFSVRLFRAHGRKNIKISASRTQDGKLKNK